MRKEHTPKTTKKKDDIEFEIAFLENVLKGAPNFIEALVALGDSYTKAGFWQKGLEVDLKLTRLRPQDAIVYYNLACSYALLNQTRPALAALSKAFDFGYNDFQHLREDPDLENLFKDDHFKQFLTQVEKKRKISKKT